MVSMTSRSEADIFYKINNDAKADKTLRLLASRYHEISYNDFLELLFEYLVEFLDEIESQPESYTAADEDTITRYIASLLKATKVFQASSQTYSGGAVDLTVKLRQHEWIAEAKIAYSNDKIFEGLLQLLTRYKKSATHKGLLVYVQAGTLKDKVNSWTGYLCPEEGGWINYVEVSKNPENQDLIRELMLSCGDYKKLAHNKFDCNFSIDNGIRVAVRNFFLDLTFRPADISGNKAKKHRKNRAINELKSLYYEYLQNPPKELDTEKVLKYLEMLCRE